jgi:hypothetical protein
MTMEEMKRQYRTKQEQIRRLEAVRAEAISLNISQQQIAHSAGKARVSSRECGLHVAPVWDALDRGAGTECQYLLLSSCT